jgi:LmbE family N-acetylglucosaminyl deacetylase
MPTALFLSPHLDDAVFSCGGLAARLADSGWRTVLATVFTATVLPVTGFALACQLDKGLTAEVDYMALRRTEDREAAAILGFAEVRWLNLPEAPHRGYHSAPALFQDVLANDSIATMLTASLIDLAGQVRPDLTLVPQALGNHVDHQVVVAAAKHVFGTAQCAYYRDTPYAIRQPDAAPSPQVPSGSVVIVPIDSAMPRKVAAAQAYATQVNFQFQDPAALGRSLHAFALSEGGGVAAERFISSNPLLKEFTA